MSTKTTTKASTKISVPSSQKRDAQVSDSERKNIVKNERSNNENSGFTANAAPPSPFSKFIKERERIPQLQA